MSVVPSVELVERSAFSVASDPDVPVVSVAFSASVTVPAVDASEEASTDVLVESSVDPSLGAVVATVPELDELEDIESSVVAASVVAAALVFTASVVVSTVVDCSVVVGSLVDAAVEADSVVVSADVVVSAPVESANVPSVGSLGASLRTPSATSAAERAPTPRVGWEPVESSVTSVVVAAVTVASVGPLPVDPSVAASLVVVAPSVDVSAPVDWLDSVAADVASAPSVGSVVS